MSGQRLIWYTPTEYCGFDPMSLDLGVKGCTAALYNMCVEPDGSVLPCQSYYQSLGQYFERFVGFNMESQTLGETARKAGTPTEMQRLCVVSECGGGCPLQFEEPIPMEAVA